MGLSRFPTLSNTLLEEIFGDIVGKHLRELHILLSKNESEMRATEASLNQLLFFHNFVLPRSGMGRVEGNLEELDGKAIPLQSYEC